jgi:glycosyltransferase involved in cell wall biosynthesis
MTAPPLISVVIPVLDEARRIEACLDALAAQRDAPAFEVIVVDNGSQDSTPELVRRHIIGARLSVERARGPYAARNTGIGEARGDIVALTDADCLPDERWLAEGAAALAATDLAGGRIIQMPSPVPTVWERYDRATYLNQEQFVSHQGFAATANLFVKAAVFAAAGRFVPELTASGDLEFGRRATGSGFRLVYASQATVLHHPRTTLRGTWALHRKLGMGFSELARHGMRARPWRDEALLIPLGRVVEAVAGDGPPLRRRRLAFPHAVAMAARWTGRLTRRG